MKTIKKIWIWLVCFSCLIISFGCFSSEKDYRFDYEELKEKVIAVEILYLHTGEIIEGAECLAVLETEEIEPFLQEFCKFAFAEYVPPKRAEDIAVKLVYKDGAYDVISPYGGTKYNAKGEKTGHAPCPKAQQAFLDLINQYIPEE